MATIAVHPRVHQRHPELCDDDVLTAWESALMSAPRLAADSIQYVAVGFDGRGRLLEMVVIRDALSGDWLIFRAMTPPSAKTYAEFGLKR